MGGEEDVVIPVTIKMEDRGDVDNYLGLLKRKIELVQETMRRSGGSKNDLLQATEESVKNTVASLGEEISKIEELSHVTSNASTEYQKLQNTVMQMAKGMKSGKGTYSGVTEEELSAQKALAAEARKSFQSQKREAQDAANEIIPNIDKTIDELWKEVNAYTALRKAETEEGNIRVRTSQSAIAADNAIRAAQHEEIENGRTTLQQAKEALELEGKRATMTNVMAKVRELEAQALGNTLGNQNANTEAVQRQNKEITKLINKEYQAKDVEELRNKVESDNATLQSRLKQLAIMSAEAEKQLIEIKQEELTAGEDVNTEKKEELELTKQIIDLETKSVKAQITKNNAVLSGLENDENSVANIKRQTSNFYYLLRSLKMVSDQFQRMSNNANNMFRSMLTWSGRILKAFGKLSLGALNLAKAFKKTKKQSDGFGSSLKMGVKHLLSYTLGIRSIYMLFRKLRGALSEGMQALATQFPYVNKQMSSLLSSLVTMKNAVATAVQPLLTVLAPALKTISNYAIEAAYNVASFFATLTGQTFVYKAIRANEDYAASFDKAGKSAKDAKKELSGLDRLNVIHSQDDSGAGDSNVASVAEVATVASEVAKKVKKIFKDIFKPMKKAWNKEGQFVMDSWYFMLDSCKTLINDIGRDFLNVWKNDTGVRIWENILHIIGDVFLVVGYLAAQFDKAWNELDRGEKILERLQILIDIVVGGIREAADATVIWASKLEFGNLLDAIQIYLESLEKPVQTITDILVHFWTSVILPFQKYLIEQGLPDLLKMLARLNDAVDWDGLKAKIEDFNNSLEPFLEKFWQALLIILEDIGQALVDFVNSDAFDGFVDKLIEWMDNAKPEDMAKGIENMVKALALLVVGFKAMSGITRGLVNLGQILNVGMQFKSFKAGGGFIGFATGIDKLKIAISGLPGLLLKLPSMLSKLPSMILRIFTAPIRFIANIPLKIAEAFGGVLDFFAANGPVIESTLRTAFSPLAGVGMIVVGVIAAFSSFFDMFENGFSLAKEAVMLFGIALVAVGAIILGAPVIIATAIAALVALVLTYAVLAKNGIIEKWEEFKKGLLEKIHNLGKNLGVIVGKLARKAVDKVKGFFTNMKKTIKGMSWKDLGIMILKGILWVFLAPVRLMKFLLEAIWNFITGFVEGIKEGFDMHSPSKLMIPLGKNILLGILSGIGSIVKTIGSWLKKNVADKFISGVKSAFGIVGGVASKLKSSGASLMNGIKEGASEKWEGVKSWFSKKWDSLAETASGLFEKMKGFGKNIVSGLTQGMEEQSAKDNATQEKIINYPSGMTQRNYRINSPSKVMRDYGKYIMKGLTLGMEDEGRGLEKEFDSMLPTTDALDEFYEKLVNIFDSLKAETVEIVDTMVTQISTLIDKLNDIQVSADVMNKLQNVGDIEIPKIAAGFTLPTNVTMQLAKNDDEASQVDLSRLPDMMKQAFIEAIMETDRNDPGEDVIVQISGREIFRVTKDENDRYKKRHGGKSALA